MPYHLHIIDSDNQWRRLASTILVRNNFTVTISDQLLQPPHADLIFLGCDHVDHLILRFLENNNIYPVIVLSTFLDQKQMRNAFRAGAVDVTTKTYDERSLLKLTKIPI